MRWSVWLLAALFLSVPAVGQSEEGSEFLLEDPAGDVSTYVYDAEAPAQGSWDPVDLRSLRIVEDADFFHFEVRINDWPQCVEASCPDSGDTWTHIAYNGNEYIVRMGMDLVGSVYGQLLQQFGNDYQVAIIASLDTDALDEPGYVAHVPRELLVDATGSPPRRDTQFTDIHSYSYNMFSFGFIDPTAPQDPPRDAVVTQDRMGREAPASFMIRTGGDRSSGGLEMRSDAPYRASNGGAATYRYDITAHNGGTDPVFLELELLDVPDAWDAQVPGGILRLDAAETATFSILIETPFGHLHGGTETFTARLAAIDDPEVWAELEMGLHHLTIPQPSGHHPTLYFHSREFSPPFNQANAVLGGVDSMVYANTLETDEGDAGVESHGWSSLPFYDRFHFAACLEPELLLGLDMNMSMEGLFEATFTSDIPVQNTVVTGRVLYLAPGEPLPNCVHSLYQGREETVIADIEPSAPFSFSGVDTVQLPVVPNPAGDYIEFQEGATLVIEFEVDPEATAENIGPGGALGIRLMPGGRITLPLDEYTDARPAGLVGWTPPVAPADEAPFEEPPTAKGTPAVGVAAVATALWLGRRLQQS